jgi:hypothetical protein
VKLDDVVEKRRLDQALNAKEFAVLAGISYSTARGWFRLPGLPVFRGVVFWKDFVQWWNVQTGLNHHSDNAHRTTEVQSQADHKSGMILPPRATRILGEAG